MNDFLEEVAQAGTTRVLLVSRTREIPWVTVGHQSWELPGLGGRDRIELGGLILNRGLPNGGAGDQGFGNHLGLGYLELLDLLEGQPLAMQIALPMLVELPASVVAGEVRNRMAGLQDRDREAGRDDFLTAVMDYSFSRMSRRTRAHLPFLSLFQRRVMAFTWIPKILMLLESILSLMRTLIIFLQKMAGPFYHHLRPTK